MHDGLLTGAQTVTIDTAAWSAGAYVVRATVGGVTTARRVTVAR